MVWVAWLGGCSPPEEEPAFAVPVTEPPAFAVEIRVEDEAGAAVSGALWSSDDHSGLADGSGAFQVDDLLDTTLIQLEAPGFLPEPVVVDRADSEIPVIVRLLRDQGPAGERRRVLHFAGDVMLGRRYVEPATDLTAVVRTGDGGTSARAVVRAVAPMFRAAQFRSLNLETVVASLPAGDAYPAKRFLLQSPPETVSLLDELAVDVVALGNNHARDWLDIGVQSTLDVLDGAGVPHVGAGATLEDAVRTTTVTVDGYTVGFVSCTTVNGDFVNDNLPDQDAPVPPDIEPAEAWQYEFRSFGYAGTTITVDERLWRIGGLWQEIRAAETGGADPVEFADLWARTVEIFPELQDWVARRGHGGANPYDRDRVQESIAELRGLGCDLVVVQIHAGFQFLEVKSELVEKAAHWAIDDGADLVVCHHPHVLQGIEWYGEKLIAHSLGNFVFDQDFLVTFDSVVLRVIVEEGSVLEARLLPVVIDRYRPVPVGGDAARRVIQLIQERSVLPFRSERTDAGVVGMLRREPSEGSSLPRLVFERNSARVEIGAPRTDAVAFDLSAGEIVDLEPPSLTRSRGPSGLQLPGVLFGRDLFRWGDFEDAGADGELRAGTHWDAEETYKRPHVEDGAPSGVRCLLLTRSSTNRSDVLARPVARIPLSQHRWYDDSGPVDGEPQYSVRLWARLSGLGQPYVRLSLYHFDDSDPTSDPVSVFLGRFEEPFPVPADGAWHEVEIPIPVEALEPVGKLRVDAVLPYLGLSPPAYGNAVLRVDDLQFLEWRDSAELPDAFYAVDALRLSSGVSRTVELERTEP